MTFAVELENGGQSTLLVRVDAARPDNWVGDQSGVISPVVVERAIRQALRQGWSPTERGGAYELAFSLA